MSSRMFWRSILDTGMSWWHGKFSVHVSSTQASLLNRSILWKTPHEFMNDWTRLLVGYLSPSVCFTTSVTVINEVVHCPIMSQSSIPILKWLSSTSVSPTARKIPRSCVLNLTNDQEVPTCRAWGQESHATRWGTQDYCFFSFFFLKAWPTASSPLLVRNGNIAKTIYRDKLWPCARGR